MRKAFGVVRLVAGGLGIVVLAFHLDYSLGSGASALPNFFSYFTMQSAIGAVILWMVGGVIALRKSSDPRWLLTARMLMTTYQVVSGVVYTIIVAQAVARGVSIQVPWTSQVLHYWMPAYALVDWLLAPRRASIRWVSLRGVLAFPVAWGAFTMVRGALVGWYPYFFLDPYQVSGPVEFAAYGAIVLSFIVLVATILILASRYLPRPGRPPRLDLARPRRGASGREERLEARPRAQDELVVVQLGKGNGPLRAD